MKAQADLIQYKIEVGIERADYRVTQVTTVLAMAQMLGAQAIGGKLIRPRPVTVQRLFKSLPNQVDPPISRAVTVANMHSLSQSQATQLLRRVMRVKKFGFVEDVLPDGVRVFAGRQTGTARAVFISPSGASRMGFVDLDFKGASARHFKHCL